MARDKAVIAHTPGPWEAISNMVRTARTADGHGGFLVAECSLTQPARQADAHLIAAAPDLYEAMNGAMQYLEGTLGPCDDDCECLLHSFRAALAKAKGRATAPRESAQPCGCDPGEGWICEVHQQPAVKA